MAIDWDQAYDSGRNYKLINVLHLRDILTAASIKPGARVLDAGCGTGDLACKLAIEGMQVTGVDLSKSAIAQAQSTPSKVSKVAFKQLDIEHEEIEGKYDAIFLKLVVAFIEDLKEVLLKMKQALKSDGKIIIITPVRPGEADYSPKYRNISVDYEEFGDLLSSVFDNVSEQNVDYSDEYGKEVTFIVS